MSEQKTKLYLHPLRAISSVGSEHLVYTEGVGGSNPSLPTSIKIPMNEIHRDFLFSKGLALALKNQFGKQKIFNVRQHIGILVAVEVMIGITK